MPMVTVERRRAGQLAPVAAAVAIAVVVGLWHANRASGARPEPVLAVRAESIYQFDTLVEMVAASDLIIRGEVISTERGRIVGDPSSGAVVSRVVTVAVRETLTHRSLGEPATVLIEEEGWLADGTAIAVNGMAPSTPGDTGIWFLDRVGVDEAPTYLVLNSQGRYLQAGTALRGGDPHDALVQRLSVNTIEGLRSLILRAMETAP
jgi:hypothetical protein